VRPDALARRLRVTTKQATRFMVKAGIKDATWKALHDRLGFGPVFPICHRPDEMAKMLGVSRGSVRRWIESGKLVPLPYLRPARIPADQTMAFMAARSTGRASPLTRHGALPMQKGTP
jgi:excisionase family DNA binding protein